MDLALYAFRAGRSTAQNLAALGGMIFAFSPRLKLLLSELPGFIHVVS